MNIVALDDSWNRIISLDDQPTNSKAITLYYDDDNRHGFFVKVGAKATNAGEHLIQEDIPLNQWIHIVDTYDGSKVSYYVDGKLAIDHTVAAELILSKTL